MVTVTCVNPILFFPSTPIHPLIDGCKISFEDYLITVLIYVNKKLADDLKGIGQAGGEIGGGGLLILGVSLLGKGDGPVVDKVDI